MLRKQAIFSALDKSKQVIIPVVKSPVFLIALSIKLAASALFASNDFLGGYLSFVDFYLNNHFADPYQHFVALGQNSIFPFPKLMLWIIAAPSFLWSVFAGVSASPFFSVFISKLPLLISDFAILVIFLFWFKDKSKKVLYWYWCSPILFFINYIYGQLDVIPIALIFVFLFFLFKEKLYLALIFLSLALATKTGVSIIMPFVIVYLLVKRFSFRHILLFVTVPFLTFLIINFSNWQEAGLSAFMASFSEQRKILDFHYQLSNGLIIYFAPIVYLGLFLRSLTFRSYNRDLFLMFLGFSFGIITLFTAPLPGWYYWVMPFFIYFYIKQERASTVPLVALILSYFAYFIFASSPDTASVLQLITGSSGLPTVYQSLMFRGVDSRLISNIIFSILQGALLLNILWIYQKGLKSITQYKISYQPYFIGIAGDSASGKSTLAKLLTDIFSDNNVLTVAGDDMHKWERGHAMWQNFTPLDPRANELHYELQQAVHLKHGNIIERRHYDHSFGRFGALTKHAVKKIVLFEGLHALFLNRMREVLDLRIFLKPDEDLRQHWKILRDTAMRGYNQERVFAEINMRADDAVQYIKKQERYADITIAFKNKHSLENMYLEITCSNDVNLDPLLSSLAEIGKLTAGHVFNERRQKIVLDGFISAPVVSAIASRLIPELEELVVDEPQWSDGYNGLIQLFIFYVVFERMRAEKI